MDPRLSDGSLTRSIGPSGPVAQDPTTRSTTDHNFAHMLPSHTIDLQAAFNYSDQNRNGVINTDEWTRHPDEPQWQHEPTMPTPYEYDLKGRSPLQQQVFPVPLTALI